MNPLLLMAALMGVLGLAIGSFLNVVIYRVPRAESVVNPPSHCPGCDTPIKGRHNVPVLSWLVLRGRCASCSVRISARYPLVEAGTGLLFAAVTLRFGVTAELPAFLYLAAIAVALAMIDFDVRRVPDSIVMPSYVVALALLMPAGAEASDWGAAGRSLVGMGALVAMLFTFALAFPNGIDFGAVKLAGLLGLYLAWLSWDALFIGVVGTLAIAAISGLATSAGRSTRGLPRSITPDGARVLAVPFGPCLIAATVVSVFIAVPVTTWYGSFLTV